MTRLISYNVHRCVGMDRRLDLDRIVGVIAEFEPDIVCLQELDVGRARTGGVDQAAEIARKLAMTVHFHPAMRVEAELYGDAVLTHLPERLVKTDALPTVAGIPGLEPRGALWTRIEVDGQDLNIMNTPLGLVPREYKCLHLQGQPVQPGLLAQQVLLELELMSVLLLAAVRWHTRLWMPHVLTKRLQTVCSASCMMALTQPSTARLSSLTIPVASSLKLRVKVKRSSTQR